MLVVHERCISTRSPRHAHACLPLTCLHPTHAHDLTAHPHSHAAGIWRPSRPACASLLHIQLTSPLLPTPAVTLPAVWLRLEALKASVRLKVTINVRLAKEVMGGAGLAAGGPGMGGR